MCLDVGGRELCEMAIHDVFLSSSSHSRSCAALSLEVLVPDSCFPKSIEVNKVAEQKDFTRDSEEVFRDLDKV